MSKTVKLDQSNIQDILPLTSMQQSMLFQYLNNQGTEQYFEQLCLSIKGEINISYFIKAWQHVAVNNEMLRTIYRWEKLEHPMQVVLKTIELPIKEIDLTEMEEEKQQGLLDEIKKNDRLEIIDISTAPFRIKLCKTSNSTYEMIISNHHILYDGWSNGIILKEFVESYNCISIGKEPVQLIKTEFRDFIKWQNEQDKEEQKEFWKAYLSDFDSSTILPYDSKVKSSFFNTSEVSFCFSDEQINQINKYIQKNDITSAALFYTAWGILLQKYSNNEDVTFGVTVAGRPQYIDGINDTVGLFINTLPLRVNESSKKNTRDFIDNINHNLDKLEKYECTSLPDIKVYGDIDGREELFNSIVVVENYPLSKKINNEESNIKIEDYSMFERTNFDLTLAVMAFDKMELKLIYNADAFNAQTINDIFKQYSKIIDAMIITPEKAIAEINIVSDIEKNILLTENNKTKTDFPKDKTLNDLFEEQVDRVAEHIALVFENNTMTYSELNKKANQFAGFLREKGVQNNTVVGLVLERSMEMMVSILGVLKAGGTYLPLDYDLPNNRIIEITKDANVHLMIVNNKFINKLSIEEETLANNTILSIVGLENVMEQLNNYPVENLNHLNSSDSLAYIMYTSGSTGIPKGIQTTHYNISRVVKETNYINITEKDVLLQLSNYAFDGSTFDIFGSLLNGATLVLGKKDTVLDVYRLSELIKKQKVTVFFITTALFNTLVECDVECLLGIRKVLFGGERVSVKHVKKAFDAIGSNKMIHVYGPTETTVFATYYLIDTIDEALGTVPIGKPIANTELYVLDKNMMLVPKGVPGELYIGGDGLSKGYLNREQLTNERFVTNPFISKENRNESSSKLYKTGDSVRWLHDNNIEFLDRLDSQVKLRGFRIELGEIEAKLMSHEAINKAVVLAKNDNNGSLFLCAYIVNNIALEIDILRSYLSKNLPDYMIPSKITILDEMPLNTSGKVNKKELLKIEDEFDLRAKYEAPSNYVEIALQNIWQEVLNVEDIGINDGFFELGGHSLKATVIASKIHKTLDVEVPLGEILKNPTIKELAKIVAVSDKNSISDIVPIEEKEYYNISSAQKTVYVQQQSKNIGISYNMPVALILEGELDRVKLKNVFSQLINNHEVLRTSFNMVDGQITQKIQKEVPINIDYLVCEEMVLDSLIEEFIKPFDLGVAPLMRAQIIKMTEKKHVLLIDIHHIISDGVSMLILLKELISLYEGQKPNICKVQYKDFVQWQSEFVKSEDFKKQEDYWLSTYSKEIPVIDMPLDFLRPDKRSFKGDCVKFEIQSETAEELNILSRKSNVTLNTLLICSYAVLLSRYCNKDEMIIGSLTAGRRHPDVSNMMGMFNNFLPLKIDLSNSNTFNEFIQFANKNIMDAYENQDYPFDKLVENLATNIDQSRNPLFDTMLILHNELEQIDNINFGNLVMKNYQLNHQTSKLDFKLDIYSDDTTGNLKCIFEYNTALFRKETIERFSQHYLNIINEIVKNPAIDLSAIEMLDKNEKEKILQQFNDTTVDYPKDKTIYQLFEEQVEKTPDNIAIIFKENKLTYRALNNKANQLARVLREKGVTQDTIVGIMVDRSLEMSISIMAIVKAGGAYLPISPNYPLDRIKFMLTDSNANILLTQNKSIGKVTDDLSIEIEGLQVINVDDESMYTGESNNLGIINTAKDLAYIIYTSGSTGQPKGAMIEHHSLVNRINWMQRKYPIGGEDTILQKTPYTFDVSVWELFWWSTKGAKVCFLEPDGEKDPRAIVDAIKKNNITTMHFVPSMLTVFLEYIENRVDIAKLCSLKQIFASGEALNAEQVKKFNALLNKSNDTKLHNLYGPTEATVDVSYFNCSEGMISDVIPIGKPIDNIQLYILNKDNKIQPIGVPGELHIAGVGLARGYLNRAILTQEKFVDNPFITSGRMYKTGDLTRWAPDGNIEFLGRIDNQVKIRGFRIEPGEIESKILKHENVKEAVVIPRTDKEGNKYLCAYIVSEMELLATVLKAFLLDTLPEYMIPSYFIKIEKMPLSLNGKLDRKALPEPEIKTSITREYVAPTNDTEKRLIKIWENVLNTENIGINDNFFELGGHSLNAATLALKIHKEFDSSLALGEIFDAQTLKELAATVDMTEQKAFTSIGKIDFKEYHPVSSSQKRLFIINKLEGNNTTYNLPSMVTIDGKVDIEHFENVFYQIIERHESLRTSFKMIGDEPVQIVHDEPNFNMEYFECKESELVDIASKFIRPFDLNNGHLIRVALAKYDKDKYLLMFDLHHIIADGVSSVVLVKEFVKLYSGQSLPALTIQFKDFAAWQNELNESEEIEKQQQYWLDTFKGTIPILNLPTDYTRPSMQSNEGARLSLDIDSKMFNDLKKLALDNNATLYIVLLAVYNTLLYKYSGQEDIVVGTPTAGRQHADVENVIGMFVNTLALRNYPEGNKTFKNFLEEVRKNSMNAYENQDYQFEKLVDELDIPRDVSRNPLFDTMFVLQNMGIPQMDFEGLKFLPFEFQNNASKFDITFEVVENPNDLSINIEYCTKLFKKETIERLAQHFKGIISEVLQNSEVQLNSINMLSESEKNKILYEFNNTKADYPQNITIHELFELQVEKSDQNTAAIFKDNQYSYKELNAKANQLARILRNKGVKRDSVVGVMLERSLEMSIGLMAILKAGGAYIPISPDYPDERIKYMLEDSGARILLTNACFEEKSIDTIDTLFIENSDLYMGDDTNLSIINKSTDLAYIIYTSGSTGKPKGTMIAHYSLINRLNWMQSRYPIGKDDTILQKTPYTFDVSVWEQFWWSIQGSKVYFLEPGGEKDPQALVDAIEKQKITTMHFVPSMLTAFLTYIENGTDLEKLSSLKQVFASGETLTLQQVKKFNNLLNEQNGTKLHNLYGPTEATIDVSYFDCSTDEELDVIPIGKPIDNINLFVLNSNNILQPIGVPGELHIAGDGLARGYLNRPELTKEKFVNNPFNSRKRMYKTGDLARWMADGNIEFLGRIDNQVKVRGFRIELGEVETQILEHESIKEVVVTVRKDGEGAKYLCSYIVSTQDLTVTELRDFLSQNLPEYMIPTYFITLESIPLSPNGKVDRKALPAPEGDVNTGREYVEPTNEVEEKILAIWKEVLGSDKISIHDKFFELGGYSILLIKMHSKVDELYPGKITITDMFAHPTISQIAEFIMNSTSSNQKEVNLQELQLPLDYFNIEEKANKETSFKLRLDDVLIAKIQSTTECADYKTSDILISVYSYLLSQLSGEDIINVQVSGDSMDEMNSLNIELANIEKFIELIQCVALSSKNIDEKFTFSINDINAMNIKKEKNAIIPLMYKAGYISDNFDTLSVFDIAFELDERSGKPECLFRFNGKKLNKQKMKEFVGLYLKILELFMESL